MDSNIERVIGGDHYSSNRIPYTLAEGHRRAARGIYWRLRRDSGSVRDWVRDVYKGPKTGDVWNTRNMKMRPLMGYLALNGAN